MSEGPRPGPATTDARRPGSDGRVARVTRRFGWLLVLALLAVPMAVIPGDNLTVVSLWGFLSTSGPGIAAGGYPVWAYFLDQSRPFAALPASIRAWPLAIGFHLLSAASAVAGAALGREDRRVTGGLLVLAAAATLWVAAGLGVRFGVGATAGWFSVLPAGAVATLLVAVGAYGRDLRGIAVR